ncbi:hypothetical protein AMATHDRAFT_135225 [Amanita thiersii Skay4041]|uniref:Uncharacterized protein n=1 Tax=Amanita thiersii Skay4041 TaxID=703135 RepID=A0A2A9P077_9AGAR|nr:hypothetical protein AMATHDRAFT_135225 [Amanita thiersii Skay4041]
MSDPRFARLKSDPRFRRPRKNRSKVALDDRFKSVFKQEKQRNHAHTISGGRVDKYGRPISDAHESGVLRSLHRTQGETSRGIRPVQDYARGDVLLESSDDENDKSTGSGYDTDDTSDHGEVVIIGGDANNKRDVDAEINLDENDFADLDAQAAAYSQAHPEEPTEQNAERTRRLAAVNLDWDHVRAVHLYRICSSLVSPTASLPSTSSFTKRRKGDEKGPIGAHNVIRGQVLNVKVYPSEFGKKRMAREEKEGPPAEIFKHRRDGSEDVNEKNIFEVGDEEDYDEDALRKYQLERLRYYYAIITCDTGDTASHIYNELDGTELERSANVIDLSFVPDDMQFDDECRDEATEKDLNTNYKPLEFVTDALRHSKVKLTWDDDDAERNHVTRRTLTRKEIEDADFRAYIASSSESESEEDADANKQKKGTKAAERDRLRAMLLGGGNDHMPEGWGNNGGNERDVDMEITFTPGLSERKDEEHETTLDKYQRKMREKRKKRKDEVKERAAIKEDSPRKGVVGDDFFAEGSDEEIEDLNEGDIIMQGKREKPTGRKEKTVRKNSAGVSRDPVSAEELALLVSADRPDAEPKHFNLKSVMKAEKRSKHNRKGKKKGDEGDNELQEDFVINVKDERFKALHEDPQFAIDPSNPRFKNTKSMASLLEERQRRQKGVHGDADDGVPLESSATPKERKLQSLVESVKRKSAGDMRGSGKRKRPY